MKFFLLFLFFLIFNKSLWSFDISILRENLSRHVFKLSQEIGERNYVNYENLNEALSYIKEELTNYGYKVSLHQYQVWNKSYFNVSAIKRGFFADKRIIVVAHYDSAVTSPGADDNASGVAGVLELARLFASKKTLRSIEFVFFTNEEPPFLFSKDMGSRRWVEEILGKKENVIAVICLEMIGYFKDEYGTQGAPPGIGCFYSRRGNFIMVVSNLRSYKLAKEVTRILRIQSELIVRKFVAPTLLFPAIALSDHSSFWKAGIPAVMITDTAFYRNPNYHKSSDLPQTLDYNKMAQLIKGLYFVLNHLASR